MGVGPRSWLRNGEAVQVSSRVTEEETLNRLASGILIVATSVPPGGGPERHIVSMQHFTIFCKGEQMYSSEDSSCIPMRSITDLDICRGNLVFTAVQRRFEATGIHGCRSSKSRRRRCVETRQIVTLASSKPRWDAIKITMPAGENPNGTLHVSLVLSCIAIIARTEENDA